MPSMAFPSGTGDSAVSSVIHSSPWPPQSKQPPVYSRREPLVQACLGERGRHRVLGGENLGRAGPRYPSCRGQLSRQHTESTRPKSGTAGGRAHDLERKGLVVRQRHPRDRRAFLVWPTESGRTARTEAVAILAEQQRCFLSPADSRRATATRDSAEATATPAEAVTFLLSRTRKLAELGGAQPRAIRRQRRRIRRWRPQPGASGETPANWPGWRSEPGPEAAPSVASGQFGESFRLSRTGRTFTPPVP